MAVEIKEDSIRILDTNFEEVVGWTKEEWEEDSNVVISIANALRIYYLNGVSRLKEILKNGG